MKKIVCAIVTLIVVTSCSINPDKEYSYIEVVEESSIFGGYPTKKDKEKKSIMAKSDSAAYIQAYRLFAISKKVREDMKDSGLETVTTPISFRLLNEQNEDITGVSFVTKQVSEIDIDMHVFSKPNLLQENEAISLSDNSNFINGIEPVDVYLNMEKQGFETSKQLGGEYGNSWRSSKSYAGIDYNVDVYSRDIDNVESVTATAVVDVNQNEIISTQQFFIYVSSLPYDGANSKIAEQWIKDNFNNNKAYITIGDARFTMYAPTLASRTLLIEKTK